MLSTKCRTVCRYLLHPISSALVLQSICLLQRSLKGTHRSPQANWFGSHAERKYGKCYDPYKNRKNLPDSGWGRVVRIGNSQNWTENLPDSGWGRVFRIGNSQNWTQMWVRSTASMWRDCCRKKKNYSSFGSTYFLTHTLGRWLSFRVLKITPFEFLLIFGYYLFFISKLQI